jgi:hypothetical protein
MGAENDENTISVAHGYVCPKHGGFGQVVWNVSRNSEKTLAGDAH